MSGAGGAGDGIGRARSGRRTSLAVGVAAEIKSKLPVADVVGETVQLKKAGTTFKGLCPFHGEKTPSFTVTPGRDTWHCFGCGQDGDIFTFVMERDGDRRSRRRSRSSPRGRRRDRRADDARGRPHGPAARRPGGGDRLLPRGPDRLEAGRARARLPPRPRLHRRDDRDAPAGLGARRLGHARPAARREAPGPAPTSSSRSASPAAPARGGGVYDRFRERVIFPIRDANGSRSGSAAGSWATRRRRRPRPRAEVPQLPGDAAVRQEPDAVPHRPGQGARSARAARPSSSRATPTR